MAEVAGRTFSRVHHVAYIVRDIEASLAFYRDTLGLPVGLVLPIESDEVIVAFLEIGETKIELVQPTTTTTGVARFLEKKGEGFHHVCFETPDVDATLADLAAHGVEIIDEEARKGAEGPVAFIHPRSCNGVLTELIEAPGGPAWDRLGYEGDPLALDPPPDPDRPGTSDSGLDPVAVEVVLEHRCERAHHLLSGRRREGLDADHVSRHGQAHELRGHQARPQLGLVAADPLRERQQHTFGQDLADELSRFRLRRCGPHQGDGTLPRGGLLEYGDEGFRDQPGHIRVSLLEDACQQCLRVHR